METWVLHKRWSGDTSAYVTFFTREKGLLSCLYKGGRTPKKQPLVQTFTPLWLSLNSRGEWDYVRQVEILSTSLHFVGQNKFAGLYLNELLYYVLRPHDPHPILYDAYVHALHAMTVASDRLIVEAILRRFEWTLLISCGYQMSLTHDARSAMPILAGNHYRFIAGEGFILNDEGICGAHIVALAQDKLNDANVLKTAKWIMRRAVDHVLDGKLIKARELYTTRD